LKSYFTSWDCAPDVETSGSASSKRNPVNTVQLELLSGVGLENSDKHLEGLVEETHQRIEALWAYMAEAFTTVSASSVENQNRLTKLEDQLKALSARIESLSDSVKETEIGISADIHSAVEELRTGIIEMRSEHREETRARSDKLFNLLANQSRSSNTSSHKKSEAPEMAVTAELKPLQQTRIPREELIRYVEDLSNEKPKSSVRGTFLDRFCRKTHL